jgi:tRNA (guanine-N7-)-methyltransferase
MSELNSEIERTDIVNRWISTFASSVADDILREHVLEECNYLWHVFSWGKVPCFEGDQARRTFDDRKCNLVYMFRRGRSINNFPRIEGLTIANKVTSEQLELIDDIYVVDLNFSWTYVNTHESECGPYFAFSNKL